MPLPWKKEKSNNINRSLSRFINEIRASKRGESLVVETGFPTSVIHLIVKNRNRFNSAKNHRDYRNSSAVESCANTPRLPNTPLAPFILNSINTLLSEAESDDLVREAADSRLSELEDGNGKEICVINPLEEREFEIQEDDSEVEESVRKGGVFMIVIKVFVVLILAISTKKFAISITLSAFILLFIEILFKAFANEYRRLMVSVHFGKGERRLSLIGVDDDIVVANFVDYRQEFEGLIKKRKVTEIEFGDSEVKDDTVFEFSGGDRSVVGDEMIGKPRRTVSDKVFELFGGDGSVVGDEMMGKPRRTVSDKLRAKFKKLGGELKNRRSKKNCKLEPSNGESKYCVIEDAGEDQDKDEDNDDCDEEGVERKVVDSNQENIGSAKMKDGEEIDVGATFERPRRTVSNKVRAKRFVKKLGDELKHRRSNKERKLDKNTVQSTKEETIQEVEEQEKDLVVDDDHNDEDAEEEDVESHDLINISEASSDSGFQKSMGRRRNWSWSTYILVVIVLTGLVGGRIMALVLSILCLLLHKLIGAT